MSYFIIDRVPVATGCIRPPSLSDTETLMECISISPGHIYNVCREHPWRAHISCPFGIQSGIYQVRNWIGCSSVDSSLFGYCESQSSQKADKKKIDNLISHSTNRCYLAISGMNERQIPKECFVTDQNVNVAARIPVMVLLSIYNMSEMPDFKRHIEFLGYNGNIADEHRNSNRIKNSAVYSTIQKGVLHDLIEYAESVNITQALYLPVAISGSLSSSLGVLRIDNVAGSQCSGVLFLENGEIHPESGMKISRHATMEYRSLNSDKYAEIGTIL